MSDMSFEQLLNDYLPENFKSGSILDGVITRKDMEYSFFLDINNKLEGRIRTFEIEGFEVGDTISVQVIRAEDDYVIVSKMAIDRIRELESYNVNDVVTGTVTKKIKGGYTVKIKSNNAFLPNSLSGSNDLVGKTLEFLVKEKSKKGLTVSRTDLAKKELIDFFNTLELNSVVKAKVKEILDFGAILELGPTTGLLHISELSWGQIKEINSVIQKGQELEVKIIDLNKDKLKIKFSLKQLAEDPWLSVKERYTIGEKRSGTIKEVLDFGLIINIDETNDEGFMHISDINYRKFFKLDKSFKVGDKIDFTILLLNDEKQRISLSAKTLLDKTWDNIDNLVAVGDIVPAKILFIQEYGMFVELENKLEAFVRRSEFSWTKEEEPDFKEEEEIEVYITYVDKENKKLSASIKELYVSPWSEALEVVKVGDIIKTTVADSIESGLLVNITQRFKGLVPTKELDKEYNINDEITAIVIDANKAKNSIILSVKRIDENIEKEELDELKKKYVMEEK